MKGLFQIYKDEKEKYKVHHPIYNPDDDILLYNMLLGRYCPSLRYRLRVEKLLYLMRRRKFNVIKYMDNLGYENPYIDYRYLYKTGKSWNIIKYLLMKIDMKEFCQSALLHLCLEKSDIPVFRYVYSYYSWPLKVDELMSKSHFPILKELFENRNYYNVHWHPNQILLKCADLGKLRLLKEFPEYVYPIRFRVLKKAAANDHLHILKYFYETYPSWWRQDQIGKCRFFCGPKIKQYYTNN